MSSEEDNSNDTNNEDPAAPSLASQISSLRKSVRQSYPEIDQLYSDAYLSAVLSVPDRTYEYARDEKISKALEWRRDYGVDLLTEAFRCDENAGIFYAKERNKKHKYVFRCIYL